MWLDRSLKHQVEPLLRPVQDKIGFCMDDYRKLTKRHEKIEAELKALRREVKILRKGL
jgi:hypothetical protein